jgi:hypothetical protein
MRGRSVFALCCARNGIYTRAWPLLNRARLHPAKT